MALPRHHASDCNQRRGTESKFVGAEKRSHDYVAAGFESAINAQPHAPAIS